MVKSSLETSKGVSVVKVRSKVKKKAIQVQEKHFEFHCKDCSYKTNLKEELIHHETFHIDDPDQTEYDTVTELTLPVLSGEELSDEEDEEEEEEAKESKGKKQR